MTSAAGGLLLLLLVITSGFAIVRQSIHPYYIWAYYIRCTASLLAYITIWAPSDINAAWGLLQASM